MSVLKIRFQSQTDRVRFSEGPKVYRSDRPIISDETNFIFSQNETKTSFAQQDFSKEFRVALLGGDD